MTECNSFILVRTFLFLFLSLKRKFPQNRQAITQDEICSLPLKPPFTLAVPTCALTVILKAILFQGWTPYHPALSAGPSCLTAAFVWVPSPVFTAPAPTNSDI